MNRHRVRWGVAATLTTAALVFAPLVPAAAEDTVLSAVDFEDGTIGEWVASGGDDSTLSVIDLDGSKVLQVADRNADFVGIQSPLGIFEAGATYDLSARVKLAPETPATSARLVMKPAYEWIGNTPISADAWTTIEGSYTVPEGADTSELQLYIGTSDITDVPAYTYYVDDLEIVHVGGDTGGGDDGGGDGGTPPGDTALSNDFEEGLGGWGPRDSGSGAPVVTLVDDPVFAGTGAAALTERTSQGSGFGHDIASLEAETTYEVSAQVRFGAGQPAAPVWMTLERTFEGATTYATLAQFTSVTNSGWTEVRASFPLSAFDSGRLYFETDYNGTNTSDLYFDDIVVSVPEPAVIEDITPLMDTLDMPVGVAIDRRETTGVASELLLRHFDQVSAENHMKPDAWYDAEGNFRTNPEADAIMRFAADNDLDVYGHVLVWHSQTPAFFFQAEDGSPLTTSETDRQILRDRMRTHIFNIAEYLADTYGAYGGGNPITAWDVVNEVVSDSSEFEDGLRRSEWYRILGEEFIDLSFQYADEAFNEEFAAPGSDRPVTLFINDYNTEQSGKQTRYLALIERMLSRGVPIDGVGHQFHVSLAMPVSALEGALERFTGLGLTQAVTELDVTTGTPVNDALLVEQGYYYRDAFRVFRDYTDELFSVTVWGLTDGRSWRSGNGAPLLFDDRYLGKPAYYGAVDEELPARQRSAFVFGGSVPLTDDAASALEWSLLPLLPVESIAQFQMRWEPDEATVLVKVDDTTVQDADGIDLQLGDTVYSVARSGEGDREAVVTEREGGYDVVTTVPLEGAQEGDTLAFDVRVRDGEATQGWNTTGQTGIMTLVEPVSYLAIPEAAETPVIDGEIEAGWDAAPSVSTDRQVSGTGGATAEVRTLWQGNNLFVLAEVTDPIVDVTGSDPWIQDSVEFYLDAGNVKNGSYRYDDMQVRINADNTLSFGTGDEPFQRARVESTAVRVDGGYVIEARLSLLDSGGEGTFHGLDFQVNDASEGTRTGIRNWADPTGAGYQSTARWGVAQLVAADVVDPTDPTDPTDPVDPTDPTDPVDPTDPTDPGTPGTPGGSDDGSPVAAPGSGSGSGSHLATTGVELPWALALLAALSLLTVGGIAVRRGTTLRRMTS